MTTSKLMCRELDANACCLLRETTANQITTLCCISEAFRMKSFERATTELRTDLDTPTLAETIQTTAGKLEITEQRKTTLEASLTRHSNLRLHGELFKSHRHSYRRGCCQPLLQESLYAVLWCRARGNAEGVVFVCELPDAEFTTVCVRTGAV